MTCPHGKSDEVVCLECCRELEDDDLVAIIAFLVMKIEKLEQQIAAKEL